MCFSENFQQKTLVKLNKIQNFWNFFYSFLYKHLQKQSPLKSPNFRIKRAGSSNYRGGYIKDIVWIATLSRVCTWPAESKIKRQKWKSVRYVERWKLSPAVLMITASLRIITIATLALGPSRKSLFCEMNQQCRPGKKPSESSFTRCRVRGSSFAALLRIISLAVSTGAHSLSLLTGTFVVSAESLSPRDSADWGLQTD